MVSLSYYDAGRWLDAQETVEQVPARNGWWRGCRAFVDEHHVVEPKRRKRPESFRTLTNRFGQPAGRSVREEKSRGRGMAEGFLGRWSQRKQAQRAGMALQEPLDQPATQPGSVAVDAPDARTPAPVTVTPEAARSARAVRPGQGPPPPPRPRSRRCRWTMCMRLTTESDFKPFVAARCRPRGAQRRHEEAVCQPALQRDGPTRYLH